MHRPAFKIRALGAEARGEVMIGARSERPRELSLVMRSVVIPALLNVLIPEFHDQEAE